MRTVRDYFTNRLGRRGTLLMIYGTGYAMYGVAQFVAAPATRFGDIGPLTALINSHAIGLMWIAGGLTGLAVAARPRREYDGIGFIAVLIPLLAWVGLYAISWVVGLVTGGESGNSHAWATIIVWSFLGTALPVIAGWPDPDTDRGEE